MGTNGGDMRQEIEQARAHLKDALGVPLLGQAPPPRAQVVITLLANGQVNLQASGDEIVTRFLLSKGVSIYEQIIQGQLKAAEGA